MKEMFDRISCCLWCKTAGRLFGWGHSFVFLDLFSFEGGIDTFPFEELLQLSAVEPDAVFGAFVD